MVAPFKCCSQLFAVKITEITPSSGENNGTDNSSDKNLSDSEYADNFVLMNEDPCMFEVFLDRLNDSFSMARMRFALSEGIVLFTDWIGLQEHLVLAVKELDGLNKFSYLVRIKLADGCTSNKVFLCLQEAQLVFTS